MKKDTKDLFKAWGFILLLIIGVIVFLYLTGCKILEKGAKTELDEHIDKRIDLRFNEFKTGPQARDLTRNGIKQMLSDYAFEGTAAGGAGLASWAAAYFAMRYKKEKKKNKKES